jgi:hypothetical protein
VHDTGKSLWKRESPHKVRNPAQVIKMAKYNEFFLCVGAWWNINKLEGKRFYIWVNIKIKGYT